MRGESEGQFLCLRVSGNGDICSRITQMTPPKPLLSILTPVGLTQSSAAHCMVSTQDLSRVTPSPSSVLTDSVSLDANTPDSPLCLSRKVCRASIWRQTWWRWSRCMSLRAPVLTAPQRPCLPPSCFSALPQVRVCGLCACVDSPPFSLAAVRPFRAWHSLGETT